MAIDECGHLAYIKFIAQRDEEHDMKIFCPSMNYFTYRAALVNAIRIARIECRFADVIAIRREMYDLRNS